MSDLIEGWKIVRPDGTTHQGYAWPLVNARAGQSPVRVDADPKGREFTIADECPQFEGDGLCLAETAAAASSGGIRLAECVGLIVHYRADDVLARGDGKIRVKGCTVVDIWSPLDVIRAGLATDLRNANLQGANMWGANLRNVDLRRADLRAANLQYACLQGAVCSSATLWPNGFDPDKRGVIRG